MPSIEIIVPYKDPNAARRRGAKRGPLGRRLGPEYLPRRLKAQKYVNFYDIGQILFEGNWIDLPFYKSKPYSLAFSQVGSPVFGSVTKLLVDKFTAADFDDFYGEILGPAIGTWKSVYRRIAKSKSFAPYAINYNGFTLNGTFGSHTTIGEWTEDGLNVPAAPAAVSITGDAYCTFDTGNLSDYKITTVPDPGAASASFVPGTAFDVYLVPKLGLQVVVSGDYYNSEDNLDHEFLGFQHRVYPRNLHPKYEDPTLPSHSTVDTAGRYSAFLAKLKAQTGTRATRGSLTDISPYPPAFYGADFDPVDYPSQASWWYAGTGARGGSGISAGLDLRNIEPSDFAGGGTDAFFEGGSDLRLVGVIVQAGAAYYIWDSVGKIVNLWDNMNGINGAFVIGFGPDASFLNN